MLIRFHIKYQERLEFQVYGCCLYVYSIPKVTVVRPGRAPRSPCYISPVIAADVTETFLTETIALIMRIVNESHLEPIADSTYQQLPQFQQPSSASTS